MRPAQTTTNHLLLITNKELSVLCRSLLFDLSMKIESTPQEEKQFQNDNKIKEVVCWELFKS